VSEARAYPSEWSLGVKGRMVAIFHSLVY